MNPIPAESTLRSKPALILFCALTLALAFNYLFWFQMPGVNFFLFTILLVGAIAWLNPEGLQKPAVLATGAGTLFCAGTVFIHATGTSVVATVLSLFAFSGFMLAPRLRTTAAPLLILFYNLVYLPATFLELIGKLIPKRVAAQRAFGYLKLSLIPLWIMIIFLVIFINANPKFAEWAMESIAFLDRFFLWLELYFPIPRFIFLVFGFFLSLWLICRATYLPEIHADLKGETNLVRRKGKGLFLFSFTGLKKEYRIGIIMVFGVNVLLLFNNILDINWIWFGFAVPVDFNLSQFVHEGTYLLIFSILLSMSIMLWFFRANLNFYKGNRLLKTGCNIWIAQNVILLISVALRNYHYIAHHGLAYKRIGVIFFLAMVVFGLVTLYFKINRGKTFFHLFKLNSWAAFACLLLLTSVNWDMLIARYNLTHTFPGGLDQEFMFTLSDKTLPLMDKNRQKFVNEARRFYGEEWDSFSGSGRGGRGSYYVITDEELDIRIVSFINRYEARDWQSWNLPDAKAYAYFQSQDRWRDQ